MKPGPLVGSLPFVARVWRELSETIHKFSAAVLGKALWRNHWGYLSMKAK